MSDLIIKMKILSELEIKHNINSFHGTSIEEQEKLRMNNCWFINDVSLQLRDPVQRLTLSSSMLITNYFFVKKDYMEYDRYLIWVASLFLASKLNNEHKSIDYFVLAYSKVMNRIKEISTDPPLLPEEKEKITNSIIAHELLIFKEMFEKEGSIIGIDLGCYKYVHEYIRSLFQEKEYYFISQYAVTYVNDWFFTLAPLLYGEKEIALACVLLASRQLGIKITAIDEAKWYRMIQKYCEFDDVVEWTKTITGFYLGLMDKHGKKNNEQEWKEEKEEEKEHNKEMQAS